jgi:hypothetical protein
LTGLTGLTGLTFGLLFVHEANITLTFLKQFRFISKHSHALSEVDLHFITAKASDFILLFVGV